MGIKVESIMESISDVYNISISRAYLVTVGAARELGYPRPHRDGIWPRDLPGLLRVIDRRLA